MPKTNVTHTAFIVQEFFSRQYVVVVAHDQDEDHASLELRAAQCADPLHKEAVEGTFVIEHEVSGDSSTGDWNVCDCWDYDVLEEMADID